MSCELSCEPSQHVRPPALLWHHISLHDFCNLPTCYAYNTAFATCSQALGELQFDGKVSKRWLAHCIRTVIARNYPHLRIAYLDWEDLGAPPKASAAAAARGEEERAPGATDVAPRNRTKGGGDHKLLRQYSVLLQWSQLAGCVQEMYR